MHGHKIINQNHIHFITPTVVGWLDIFTRKVYKDIIIESLRYCIESKGLKVHAYVIMSNHLHLIISAKEGFKLSDILRDFKKYTASKIIKTVLENPKESRSEWMLRLFKYHAKYNKNNTTYQFWKRDNHPVELVSDEWIAQKLNYIHMNPVKAGIVDRPEEYIYSSARSYNDREGLLPIEILETKLF